MALVHIQDPLYVLAGGLNGLSAGLDGGPGPQVQACEGQPINVCLPLFLPHFLLSLKNNKIFFKIKVLKTHYLCGITEK